MKVLAPDTLVCPATGKQAYPTLERAEARLRIAALNTAAEFDPRMPYRAYECPDCGWWHLSHSHPRSAP